ncbi:MAG: glycoside hydrolase family 3 N-terminal domain-containing protein [Candidatus Promineifilaceae bacterium]
MTSHWKIILIILASSALFGGLPIRESGAQDEDSFAEARVMLDQMTVEERVGQLFIVSFQGDNADAESDIADLIVNYQVGGVILLAENDNITALDDMAGQVVSLINALQSLALLGLPEPSLEEIEGNLQLATRPALPTIEPVGVTIPLFIGTYHEGDGPPYTQIRNGTSQLPNQMAIGSTWMPEQSKATGLIAGSELSSLGINMLFGPSLDVLENPKPDNGAGLGSRTFGGDPYWVGVMGQSYIDGVHEGSDGRLAVIAKHFPGYGNSDRPLNEEIGTVSKTLDQLINVELKPFFAVTGAAPEPGFVADGLMSTHVRYQGFQGNVGVATAPVSFDPQAMDTLMQLPEIDEWRREGGIIVSDSLGAPAIQRFYDDTGQEFPHRLVAKDALLAGNDLMLLIDFALGGGSYDEQVGNIKDTVVWFREKYVTDQTFQQRIDDAALRILQSKLDMYGGDFDTGNVLVSRPDLEEASGQYQAEMFDLAQNAITLISPGPADLVEQLPPGLDDQIVIFTDLRTAQQCSECPVQSWLAVDALEQRMIALYGPEASGQVQESQFDSFSFSDLREYLTGIPQLLPQPEPVLTTTITPGESPIAPDGGTATPTPTPTPPPALLVQTALADADWIIFATLDPDPSIDSSDALELFLDQRPDVARNSRVIVFAHNGPYFLDATQISQLTAYYGVYSKMDAFVDASVRALFQEAPLRGKSPVSIEGIRYDLKQITQPYPIQVIELYVVDEGIPKSPASEAPLEVVPGSTLRLQTSIIIDANGNPVPDGTMVQFIQQDRIQGFVNVIDERPTVGGVANLDYLLEARTGNFRITASAGEAKASQEIDIVIGENAIVSVNTLTPTATPTSTPANTPTSTSTPTITPSPTATKTPNPSPTASPVEDQSEPSLISLSSTGQMLMAFGVGLIVTSSAGVAVGRNENGGLSKTLRCVLWGLIGGLVFYIYFSLDLPGFAWLDQLGYWAGLITTVTGGLIGLVVYRLSNNGRD